MSLYQLVMFKTRSRVVHRVIIIHLVMNNDNNHSYSYTIIVEDRILHIMHVTISNKYMQSMSVVNHNLIH